MHQDSLQFQTCQTFSMSKTKSKDRDTLKSPWLMPWGTLTKIAHFSEILLSHDSLFVDRNDINNFGPKGQSFKTILTWEEMLQLERPSMAYIVARSRQIVKKRTKEKLIVISCTWKIRLSLNENREAKKNVEKMMKKMHKHKLFFSCKELLFSLGNYIWGEKWPSFIILPLIENYQ